MTAPIRPVPGRVKLAQLLALAIPALLLGGAYISEYVFGMHPCEMCWWQRWPHFAAIALALLSFAVPLRTLCTGLAALAILVSGLIGLFHAGVEYKWWDGITGCATIAASAAAAAYATDTTARPGHRNRGNRRAWGPLPAPLRYTVRTLLGTT